MCLLTKAGKIQNIHAVGGVTEIAGPQIMFWIAILFVFTEILKKHQYLKNYQLKFSIFIAAWHLYKSLENCWQKVNNYKGSLAHLYKCKFAY